jgi:hypothetical protein
MFEGHAQADVEEAAEVNRGRHAAAQFRSIEATISPIPIGWPTSSGHPISEAHRGEIDVEAEHMEAVLSTAMESFEAELEAASAPARPGAEGHGYRLRWPR